MKAKTLKINNLTKKILLGITASVTAASAVLGLGGTASAAACTAPGTDYGQVTTSLSVPATATYRVWTRLMVPNTTNKTYLLEIDGANCYNVGGGSIPASTWTWVDYHSGSSSSKVQLSLSQGSHSLKLIGNAPGVKVDRVVAVSDLTCVPTGFGDNCNVPDDNQPPTVTLTAPAEGASVSGTVSLTASATDNVGVTKVEFYDNSSLITTDTSSPYGASWNSALVPNGSHLITAKAYDAAGNVSSDSSTVNAMNGDTEAPSVPGNVQATASSYNTVTVTWNASTDNKGVSAYKVFRDGVPVVDLGAVTSYTDTPVSANTTYEYQLQALDAAGNQSSLSAKATVTTPNVPDTQAPTKPAGLTAQAASETQINLTWTASTDNIGVVAYDVYRSDGSTGAQKIGSSPSPGFGDTGLTASTSYTYYVVARDAANNSSPASGTVTAKTLAPPTGISSISGVITDQASGKPIAYARVTLVIGSNRHTYQADRYGRYAMFNIQTGRYNLTFRAKGYNSKTVSVTLSTTPLVQNVALTKK